MIRQHLFHKRAPADPMFRWRGGDVSRTEALSDGVFAVTLTLLVASVQVPGTFYELWLTIRDLPVFVACFGMLIMVWHYHYIFFRRYGLEDLMTSVLNSGFLFLVLFYAYPLKFMATFLWRLVLGERTSPLFVVPAGVDWGASEFFQRAGMMYFYGLGIVGVFGMLALMVWRAYLLRDALELDELECWLTIEGLRVHAITVGIAVLSMSVLLLSGKPAWSGLVYFLMGPVHTAHGWWSGNRAERIRARLDEETNPVPGSDAA